MTKECYDELLAKVNSKYKEPRPGIFWRDISEKWDFSLSFDNTLSIWNELGFDWDAYDEDPDENGRSNRRLNFLDGDGKVVGNILTIPGQGWRWEWPQLLMDILHHEKSLIDKVLEIQKQDGYSLYANLTEEEILQLHPQTLEHIILIHNFYMYIHNKRKEVCDG